MCVFVVVLCFVFARDVVFVFCLIVLYCCVCIVVIVMCCLFFCFDLC